LSKKLYSFGIQDVSLLSSIYELSTMQILVGDKSSAAIQLDTGTALSSLLFDLFIDAFLQLLDGCPSEPRLSPAVMMNDDMLSALTPPLMLQPATSPQIVAFESWTISAPICLNRFTLAESQKPNL